MRTVFPAILAVSAFTFGQTSTFSGPISGFTFDPATQSIRAVIGTLGSASLGPSLAGTLDFASIAPRQNYAVAVRRGQTVLLSALGIAPAQVTVLSEASVPDGVAWSDDGSVAVLYSRLSNWIQICTGLPASVSVGPQVSVPTGQLAVVATDAHGQRVVVGVGGDQAGIYQVQSGESFSLLLQISAPVSLAFSPDASTLYALDQATNQISQINLSNFAVQTLSAGAADAIAIRAAVDNSGDNVLYVAGRSSQILLVVDPDTLQTIATATLSFTPAMIAPLGANGFLLAQRSNVHNLLWTFAATAQPSIYFVPAPATDSVHPEAPPR